MASALKKIFRKGKRKVDDKNVSTLNDPEEKSSLHLAFGETSQEHSRQSSCNNKEQSNTLGEGSSHTGGHNPGGIKHEMSHSLDHPGAPDCLSSPPCPDNKMPPAQQHGFFTTEQAPPTSDALGREHEHTNGALYTERHSAIAAGTELPVNPNSVANNNGVVNSVLNQNQAITGSVTGVTSHSSYGNEVSTAPVAAAAFDHEPANPVVSGMPVHDITAASSVSSHSNQESTVATAVVATATPDGELPNPVNSGMPADDVTAAGRTDGTSSHGDLHVHVESPSTVAAAASNDQPPVDNGVIAAGRTSLHGNQEVAAAATSDYQHQHPVNTETSADYFTAAGSVSSHGNQASPAAAPTPNDEPQNPVNSEMSVDGFTTVAQTSSPSNQEPPAATNYESQNEHTATTHPNEGEGSLQSLTGPPIQVEPETTSGEEATTNTCEHFLVLEKVNGNKFLQDKLALSLDRTSHRLIKTWEHLACTKEVNAPLEVRLRCKINSENSCTLMLLDVMKAEKEDTFTVKDLIGALASIGRNDAKKIITDVHPNAANSTQKFVDFAASLANSELIAKMATLLDPKSRVNKYWLHLGQRFQLSGERLKEIEYGQFNSTEVLMEYLYSTKTDCSIGKFYDEVDKLNRKDVLKKLDPFIVEEGDRDKLMKDVIELESDAMRSICVCLNNPNRLLRNWRHLAKSHVLGIPKDIYKDCEPGKPKSPTDALFEWIFAKKVGLTVGQLCSALEKIDRNDIVRDLKEHFEQNSTGQLRQN